MDKIKRFITCLIPVHVCNFRCMYCYLSHHDNNTVYAGGIKPFATEPKEFVNFFSKERLGGPCYFNLCAAGETMMHPELIDLVYELTKEGHYTDIVTNGTLERKFDELIEKLDDNQKKHLFIKFSFHYLELKKKGMMSKFIGNVNRIKNSGISYTIEITPHDELVPFIDEIKEFSIREFGALPHITVARNEGTDDIALLTKYSREEYYNIWSQFDSALFKFKLSIFNQNRKCDFCYAGLWSLAVDLESGLYSQCYGGDVLGTFKDSNKPIKFRAIGKCRLPHCFNGHAFLACGDIPELETPFYYEERDRQMTTGEHWFKPEVRDFFSSKLSESNEVYNEDQQKKGMRCTKEIRVVCLGGKVKRFIKRLGQK